ncbi:formate/nitrite transporter family protein [Acetobacter sp. DsW_063]|uniref:formate/nitrite transporter family protein n=1 Tax=Acetobacter sp. DsW_063 TaxID=1514894 RepID=UPI001E3AFD0E|nr:formate/nitrite transporter family protein [Acetobacter sp. DsW_063]
MADYVKPSVILDNMIEAASLKAALPAKDVLIRAMLAGAYLSFATTLAFLVAAQTGQFIVGAVLFPAGFVLIVLLGMELLTGNFGMMPLAAFAGRIGVGAVFRNWALVFLGNLLGSLIYAALFWIAITDCGNVSGGPLGEKLRALAVSKTTAYEAFGAAGLATVFAKAILCNWMVSLGSVVGLASTSTIGKIIGAWLPIMIFVAQGYEHSVVNMFAIPAGMMLGANVSFADWWLWNEIPVTLGNLVGGIVFTGGALYATYRTMPISNQDPASRPI